MFDIAWWPMLLLLPLPLLVRLWPDETSQKNRPLTHAGFPLTLDSGVKHKGGNKCARLGLWFIWTLLLAAAARPQWVDEASAPIIEQGRDILLAVDLSASMEIKDMQWQDKVVDRLTAVRHLLVDFVHQRRGDRLGLILFADHAYLQSPLTFDTDTIAQYVDEMRNGLVGDRTAIGEAIGMSVKELLKLTNEQRILVLLTDGQNTSGEVEPEEALQIATDANVTIYTIGVGAEYMQQRTLFGARTINPSADLDETLLIRIAENTGGKFFRATNSEELAEIYELLNALNPISESEAYYRPRQELYPWPLSSASLLLFIYLLPAGRIARLLSPKTWMGKRYD